MREFRIVRVGGCNACGFCCERRPCVHLTAEAKCGIHEHKHAYCEQCDSTHEDCAAAPSFPLRKRNPGCGYRFYIEGEPMEVVAMEVGHAPDHPVR